MNSFYRVTTSVLATVAFSQVAIAQTTGQAEAPVEDAQAGIQDIIVTAQKNRESSQRTPVAVTAISGDNLVSAGIRDLTAVQALIPSVRLQAQGSTVEIYIRGIGQTNEFANTEAPTAFTINGAYIPREGSSAPLFDLERVELVPGPQGTLYGRSVLGGAVNVVYQRPTNDFESKVILEAGNFGLFHGTAVQNIPVSADFALRAGVDYAYRDGYETSGAYSERNLSGRLSALANPTENLTIYAWGVVTRRRGNSINLVNKGFNPATNSVDGSSFLHDNPWEDTLTGPFAPYASFFGPVRAIPEKYDSKLVGGQIDWTIGDVTVTDIPAYVDIDTEKTYFLGGLLGTYNTKIKQYSNELRLSGETSRLKWQTGISLFRMINSDYSAIPGFLENIIDRNQSNGFGIYGQATYSISDPFRLTVGGRYSRDSRTGRGRASGPTGFATIPFVASVKSNHVDWKVGVEYDVAPQVMLYANVQTGYQPATYNAFPNSATFDNRVDAPTILAYTAGFKGRFLDNKLQVNSEAFYYIYKGLPLQAYTLQAFNAIFNAEEVQIYGNQLDMIFRPTDNDQLNVSVGYLHGRQTKAVTPTGLDYSGLQLQNAPDWTITAGYYHDVQVSSGYIRLAGDMRYESSFYGDYQHTPGTRQKPYTMSNANITYYNTDHDFSLGAWIKNIENEPVQAASAAGGIPGPALVYLQPPRTYGVRATFDF